MKIEEIRNLTHLNRTKFAERYGIPLRTVEDWEHGKSNPPAYVVDLLERVVREDEGLQEAEKPSEKSPLSIGTVKKFVLNLP